MRVNLYEKSSSYGVLMKFFLWLFLLFATLSIEAEDLAFNETRYINALDKTLTLSGNISFSDERIKILYKEPQEKTIIYQDEMLTIIDGKNLKTISINSEPVMGYFFMVIKAIHDENYVFLDTFFTTEHFDTYTKLTPKETVAKYLHEILFYKNKKNLKFLKMLTTAQDRIEIEVLD